MARFSKTRSLSCASSSAAANFAILAFTFAPASCSAAPDARLDVHGGEAAMQPWSVRCRIRDASTLEG